MNFASYGLPQARKRVLLIGNRIGLDFSLPPPTHSYNSGKHKNISYLPHSPTFDEALAGLGSVVNNNKDLSFYAKKTPINRYDALMRDGNTSEGVSLHNTSISENLKNLLSKMKPGDTMKNLPVEYWHNSYEKRAFRRVKDGTPTEKRGGSPSGLKRLSGNLNALTITSATPREFIHPHENRPLTLREAARLQSFPDNFQFFGNNSSIATQIGNAFPPLISKVFAEHLITLDNNCVKESSLENSNKGALIGFHLTDASGMSPILVKTYRGLSSIMGIQSSFIIENEEIGVA